MFHCRFDTCSLPGEIVCRQKQKKIDKEKTKNRIRMNARVNSVLKLISSYYIRTQTNKQKKPNPKIRHFFIISLWLLREKDKKLTIVIF